MCTDLAENLNKETVHEGCETSRRLKWGPFPQMRSAGSHSTSGREKKGKKERAGRGIISQERDIWRKIVVKTRAHLGMCAMKK